MIRVFFVHALLFALPFFGYALFLLFSTGRMADRQSWVEAPLGWLALAGGVIAIISLLVLASFDTGGRDGHYTPSIFVDGKLVPGKIE